MNIVTKFNFSGHVYFVKKSNISYEQVVLCAICNGTGYIPWTNISKKVCENCNGRGEIHRGVEGFGLEVFAGYIYEIRLKSPKEIYYKISYKERLGEIEKPENEVFSTIEEAKNFVEENRKLFFEERKRTKE